MAKTADEQKLPIGTMIRVTQPNGRNYVAMTTDGTDVTDLLESYALRNAFKDGSALKLVSTETGGTQWRKVSLAEYTQLARNVVPLNTDAPKMMEHESLVKFLKNASGVRPITYKMDDLKWRFAIRAALRGKNIMVTGPRGCGKTVLAFALAEVTERELFNIPMGATQDPRSTLIGNTHFKGGVDGGTYTAQSYFVQAIQTPNAIILLDELTRANHEAWNILMPVLDYKQRFLRIDEDPHSPTIKVADGVCFIATANIGASYTATRTLDAALTDRFTIVEVEPLSKEAELEFLREKFPKEVPDNILTAIANIAAEIRRNAKSDDPKVSEIVSTRQTIEMAELIYDGFTLIEAAEVCVFPTFSEAGGTDSERTFVKKIVQQFLPTSKDGSDTPFDLGNKSSLPWEEETK